MSLKRGKFSTEEEGIVLENFRTKTFAEIGDMINRSEEAVESYLIKRGLFRKLTPEEEMDKRRLISILHSLSYWSTIVESYDEGEVLYFEDNWADLYRQLNEDVSYSEHLFIKDWLIVELEKRRVLRKERESLEAIKKLKADIQLDIETGGYDPRELALKQSDLAAREANTKVYIDSLEKLNKDIRYFTDKIKADRSNRRDKENSSDTYWGYVAMLENEDFRKEENYRADLLRIAAEKEKKKLGEWHQYRDGVLDLPILNTDTYKAAMEREKEK